MMGPSPSRTFSPPRISSALLRNGLKAYAAPWPELPLISLHLVVPRGAEADPAGCAGLADLAAEMLTRGTRGRSALELAAEIDGMGALFSSHAGWDLSSLHLSGLREDWERLLSLLREIYTQPAFAAQEFEQLKQRRIGQLVQQKDESQILAEEQFQETLFRGTPYDHPPYGTLESVPRLTVEQAQDLHRENFLLPGSFLVFVGDLDGDRCFRWAEENFPDAGPKGAAAREFAPSSPGGIQTRIFDRPDLTQSQIRLGHIGIPHAHPDYIPFEVMNYTLGGGGFSSRLMQRIRSELGYTYGIYSSLEARKFPGPFAISTFAPVDITFSCVQEIFSVLRAFLEQGPSGRERDEAVNFFTGSYPRRFETISQIGQRIIQAELHGLGLESLSAYPQRVAGASREDLFRVARENIRPAQMQVVAVGRAENFRRSFESLGPVEVTR